MRGRNAIIRLQPRAGRIPRPATQVRGGRASAALHRARRAPGVLLGRAPATGRARRPRHRPSRDIRRDRSARPGDARPCRGDTGLR